MLSKRLVASTGVAAFQGAAQRANKPFSASALAQLGTLPPCTDYEWPTPRVTQTLNQASPHLT
jgi:hypothetical protein